MKATKKAGTFARTVPRITADGQPTELAEVPEGIIRLATYVKDTMALAKLTINTVSMNSNPNNPKNRIDPSTVWRLLSLKVRNIEDRTLILLANGLKVSPDTLRQLYLGTFDVSSTIRPVDLKLETWQRLEQSALENRRVIRTADGSELPDVSNELEALLNQHLPKLKKDRKTG